MGGKGVKAWLSCVSGAVIRVAGVGGFFRIADGRSEGGSKVVDAVLLDIDEGREALAVGLRDDCN